MNKLKQILYEQIKQGATREKISESIAWGVVFGVIPILGITSWLCLIVALRKKLNHVVIQLTHHVIYPLQLLLLIPFWRAGEILFQKPPVSLSVKVILHNFENSFFDSLKEYLGTAMLGIVVWLILSPVVYYLSKKIAFHFLKKLRRFDS